MSYRPDRPLVVIPTYNERENLETVIQRVRHVVPQASILVVDDGSPDGTGSLADQISEQDAQVHVLHRANKEGLGRAYLAGFDWALQRDFDPVFEMDADLSHDPRYLPVMLNTILDADLVLGSRYVPGGGSEGWGPLRKLISQGGSRYARSVLGLKIRDLTGGFKCFRRSALETLELAGVRSEGFAFQIEMTDRAVQRGLRVVEIPIIFADRRAGHSKMSSRIFFEALLRVWQIRFRR